MSRADALLRIFHPSGEDFAAVQPVAAAAMPAAFRTLLDHASHMTVAMERHHGGPVTLQVVQVASGAADGRGYAREILLARDDGMVVQYGIVRLDLSAVDAATAAAIRAAEVPLGRLLIEYHQFFALVVQDDRCARSHLRHGSQVGEPRPIDARA